MWPENRNTCRGTNGGFARAISRSTMSTAAPVSSGRNSRSRSSVSVCSVESSANQSRLAAAIAARNSRITASFGFTSRHSSA